MKFPLAALTAVTTSALAFAGEESTSQLTVDKSLPEWGVSMGARFVSNPFSDGADSTSDIFPAFYYEGERFFLRGDYGGVKLWKGEGVGLDAVARYRFFDIPDVCADDLTGGAVDAGLQLYRQLSDSTELQFNVLSDPDGRMHSAVRLVGESKFGNWSLSPEAEIRFTGKKYNSRYYGLNNAELGRGLEVSTSLKGRRQLYKNWHLETKGELTWLGSEAGNSSFIEDDFKYELYVGLGLFDENRSQKKAAKTLKAQPYWRLSQQWGTSSDLQNMIIGEHETVDGADVYSTSIFYGHPLSDTLFGAPVEMYLTSGVTYHYASSVQDASLEFSLALKTYFTFNTPWKTRLGIAEGISYADSLTFYESEELTEKGFSESQLLNYIDLTLDVNVGDMLKRQALEDLWLGFGIHHRSGIYGSSSAFGDISGGTNFSSIYLQWHGDF